MGGREGGMVSGGREWRGGRGGREGGREGGRGVPEVLLERLEHLEQRLQRNASSSCAQRKK
jgi:hypothetical protein